MRYPSEQKRRREFALAIFQFQPVYGYVSLPLTEAKLWRRILKEKAENRGEHLNNLQNPASVV
jgi:hypothetical protein